MTSKVLGKRGRPSEAAKVITPLKKSNRTNNLDMLPPLNKKPTSGRGDFIK